MIEITDKYLFGQVIADSLVKIENSNLTADEKKRWVNAIGKAAARMESTDFLMTWQPEKETMLIWTVGTTNQIYEANGVCQCQAYFQGKPCWHKACKQLYKRYLESFEAPNEKEEMERAMYYKPEIKSERIAGFRI